MAEHTRVLPTPVSPQEEAGGSEPVDPERVFEPPTISEIIRAVETDQGSLLGDPRLYRDLLNDDDGSLSREDRIAYRRKLIAEVYERCNTRWIAIEGTYALYAIQLGRLLEKLKKDVRDTGVQWNTWAGTFLPFMRRRTRQTFMQMARIQGVERYCFLGKDRLVALAGAVKEISGPDPVGSFLASFGIRVDPADPTSFVAVKRDVEIALFVHAARTKGVAVEFQTIRDRAKVGIKLNRRLLEELIPGHQVVHDPNARLDRGHVTRGTIPDLVESEGRKDSLSRIVDHLSGILDTVMDHPDCVDPIDVSALLSLEEKLRKFREALTRDGPRQLLS